MSMSTIRAEAPQDDVLDRRWRVKVGNRIYGPYTGHHMLRYICEGRIVPYSTVKPIEGGEWRQASADEGLRILFARAKPAKQEPPKAIPRPELKPRSKALVQLLNERGGDDADFVAEAIKAAAETPVAETPAGTEPAQTAEAAEKAAPEAEDAAVDTGNESAPETEEIAAETAGETEAGITAPEVSTDNAGIETAPEATARIAGSDAGTEPAEAQQAEETEPAAEADTAEPEAPSTEGKTPPTADGAAASDGEADTAADARPTETPMDFAAAIEASTLWGIDESGAVTFALAADDETQAEEEPEAAAPESVPLRLYGHDVGMVPVAPEPGPDMTVPTATPDTAPAVQKLIGDLVDREAIEAMTVHALRHVLHDPATPQPPHPDSPNGAPVTPLIIIANLLASTREEFMKAVEMLGHAHEVKPGIWMLTAPYAPAKVRNHLIQCLGVDDEIYVIDSKSGRIAWFNLAPEGDYSVKPMTAAAE